MRNETIVNQQATEAELGWFAGVIDGEGSITMNVRRKSWNGWKGIGVDLKIMVVNTDSGIIDKCSDILEKLNISPYVYERATSPMYDKDGKTYHNKTKTIVTLAVNKMSDILKLLTFMQKYLAGEKRTRARLIAKFIKHRLERKGKNSSKSGDSWYSKYDWELVKQFYTITGGKLLPEVEKALNEHTLSTNKS